MAPAAPPPLDINSLNFDTCERLRHLDSLLRRLGFAHGSRILDVGGYPGYMARAFPHWQVVTVDTYASGHAPYVKGSGAALPFKDDAFDATIACDVLEHVPPQYRDSFLHELSRVTQGAVIIAGPYDTPGTAAAERLVRELLPASSPAVAWLAEHEECGLPNLRATVQALENAGATAGVTPAGSLTAWILFFAGQAAGERRHETGVAFGAFVEAFNRLNSAGGEQGYGTINGGGVAYRHAVIGARNELVARRLGELNLVHHAGDGVDSEESEPRRKQIDSYVERLGALLRMVGEDNGGGTGEADAGEDRTMREYVVRLERMLADRPTAGDGVVVAVGAPNSPAVPPAAKDSRIKRAVKVLLGRE